MTAMAPDEVRPPIDSRQAQQSARLQSAGFNILAARRFRGEVYEEDLDNEHLHDFLACHFYRKILRDALLPSTRRIGLRAANQIGKTRIGELIMKYLMKHRPGNMIIYDETIEKSKDHMRNRFMPMIKEVPELASSLREIMEQDRFDVTTQDILFPGMVFRARPLNESWTQSITVIYGMISDAALCEAEQIRRAFYRSKQHRAEEFWFVESQGDAPMGKKGGGFKEFMDSTNEMKLHVRCPCCGMKQRFQFHQLRTAETKIVLPQEKISEINRQVAEDAKVESMEKIGELCALAVETARLELEMVLRGDDRKHCGFKVEGELKLEDGAPDAKSILRNTVYECPHCAGIWRDEPETRRYLDREAGLDENWPVTNPNAQAGYLGYSLPSWINPKVAWGDEMLKFREAMAAKKMGNIMPLQEFRTKVEGEDWNPQSENRRETKISVGTYETDPDKLSFAAGTIRLLTADVGKSPLVEENIISASRLFFEIRDWNNTKEGDLSLTRGASVQITRGMVEDCFMETPDGPRKVSAWELFAAQQLYWKITNHHVLIDMAYAQSQVIEAAAKYHEIVDSAFRPVARADYGKQTDFPLCWRMCSGSHYQKIGPKKRPYHQDFIKEPARFHDKSGRKRIAYLDNIVWSNYWFEDQFERIVREKSTSISWKNLTQDKLIIVGLDGKPNAELMQKYIDFEQDKDGIGQFRSWDSGLQSRTFDSVKHKYVDNDKAPYAKKHWTEPRDCGLMQLVGAAAEGMLGHVATEE